ncbi:hypothetical protein ACFP5Z_07880, partial [Kocuria oceani]
MPSRTVDGVAHDDAPADALGAGVLGGLGRRNAIDAVRLRIGVAISLGMLQPGDHLLIAFGHNDEKVQDPARGTLPGSTFEAYLRRYVDGAVAQGAQPVLVTPVERRR